MTPNEREKYRLSRQATKLIQDADHNSKLEAQKTVLERHLKKLKKPRLLRLVVYADMPVGERPTCYQVKCDDLTKEPIYFNRPHTEFAKRFFGKQLYDQSFLYPGVYRYERLKHMGGHDFIYSKNSSGYFVLDKDGTVTAIRKSSVYLRLKQLENVTQATASPEPLQT
ncbi:hypothetical protein [Niveibacterium sp.]|uniref:hypothetical protein n=1 Tax=Niveibacterium sp. TaxID=2017444 RepID=UPI0035AFB050